MWNNLGKLLLKLDSEGRDLTNNHEGTWTLNLLIRSQTPYPLGHAVPVFLTDQSVAPLREVFIFFLQYKVDNVNNEVVARTGVEPVTLALLAPRSNQLS